MLLLSAIVRFKSAFYTASEAKSLRTYAHSAYVFSFILLLAVLDHQNTTIIIIIESLKFESYAKNPTHIHSRYANTIISRIVV